MQKTMLHRELERVPCLVRSETSAINSSPCRNHLFLVNSGKGFVRTVVRGGKSKQLKSKVLTTLKNG